MPAQFLDPLSLGESGRSIAEEKKSVVCVFDVGLSLGILIGQFLSTFGVPVSTRRGGIRQTHIFVHFR